MRRWTLGLATEGNPPSIWVDYHNDTLKFERDEYFDRKENLIPQPSFIEFNSFVLMQEKKQVRKVQMVWRGIQFIHYVRDEQMSQAYRRGDGDFSLKVAKFLVGMFPGLEVLEIGWESPRDVEGWRIGLSEYDKNRLLHIASVCQEQGVRIEFVKLR